MCDGPESGDQQQIEETAANEAGELLRLAAAH